MSNEDRAEGVTRRVHLLLMPEPFSGETRINDSFEHFENVAKINEWDAATKYMWICVRLTGMAQTALRCLHEDKCGDYIMAKAALVALFELASKKHLYAGKFYAQFKHASESWGNLTDDLITKWIGHSLNYRKQPRKLALN